MARENQQAPIRREPSSFEDMDGHSTSIDTPYKGRINVDGVALVEKNTSQVQTAFQEQQPAGLTQLVICVGGIYASFLSWALLQERITATSYGPSSSPERFTYSVFLNTIQSLFASLTGFLYLYYSTPSKQSVPHVFPSRAIFVPLLLVAIASSLASPFGYASLSHIDYITFILAKSCKLLPVMALHLTIFRRSYPVYKYLVVFLVTAGVAVFTLYHPSSSKSKKSSTVDSSLWGLFLLSINLLFDGLTNSTQDHIFSHHRTYTGPQMMVAQNLLSTLLTGSYLLFSPVLASLPLLSPLFTNTTKTHDTASSSELNAALSFIARNPSVFPAMLSFAACGAVGQIFIYFTLSQFSSLLLVTVTVTRKMLTMILSVLWFGHRLTGMQWVGVGLVFGGVGAEGWMQRREKMAKERAKKEAKRRA